jgi:hypothetical protein
MRVSVFLVYELRAGCSHLIAARLTMKAARSIARQRGGRGVKKIVANKSEMLEDWDAPQDC